MKKLIVLTIVVAAAISCKKTTPNFERFQTKAPVFIRVYSPESNAYSQTTIIKL